MAALEELFIESINEDGLHVDILIGDEPKQPEPMEGEDA